VLWVPFTGSALTVLVWCLQNIYNTYPQKALLKQQDNKSQCCKCCSILFRISDIYVVVLLPVRHERRCKQVVQKVTFKWYINKKQTLVQVSGTATKIFNVTADSHFYHYFSFQFQLFKQFTILTVSCFFDILKQQPQEVTNEVLHII